MRLSIALLLAFLVAGCDRQKAESPQGAAPSAAASPKAAGIDRSRAGHAAPDVEFLSPDGKPVSFSDFRGKPLLVNLWATWCAPCVAEMPTLDALATSRADVRVLAVSQDVEGQEEKVAAFFEERRLTSLEPYRDPELRLMAELQAATLPTTILLDSGGREVWRMTGAFEWNGTEAAKLIDEVASPVTVR